MTLTVGSLFSGIGGLELGLERAGMRTVWQVEQNEYCRKVLAKHWPDVQRFIDVRDVGAHNLPPVDLICGGFPCQDVSNAGRRAGVVVGTRSGLWYEFSRIVRELRPRYVVVENVAALLTLGLDAVLGELAESGYDAEWDCIPASALGAPHQRDRIFIVAYPASDRRTVGGAWHEGLHAVATGGEWLWGESVRGGADDGAPTVADADSLNAQGIIRWRDDEDFRAVPRERPARLCRRTRGNRAWQAEPAVGRVAHGIPARAHRIKGLGNAVVPEVGEVIGYVVNSLEAAVRTEDAA